MIKFQLIKQDRVSIIKCRKLSRFTKTDLWGFEHWNLFGIWSLIFGVS